MWFYVKSKPTLGRIHEGGLTTGENIGEELPRGGEREIFVVDF